MVQIMEMEYKQEVNDSYLILKEEDGSEEEKFQFRMITENNIPGLLHTQKRSFNNENSLYYRINGRQSLFHMMEKREADAEILRSLLRGIDILLNTLSQYLLDADSLLLIPECIYFHTTEKDIGFCFYPFEQKDIRQQLRELSEYFLERINREDEQAVSIAFRLYRMTREPNFAFSEIVEKLVYKEGGMYEEKSLQRDDEQSYSKYVSDEERERYNEGDKQSKKNVKGLYEDTEEVRNPKEQKQDKNNAISALTMLNGRNLMFLSVALAVGSFLYFLYVYAVKQYFYGYSLVQVLGTMEAIFSICLMGVFLLISFGLYFYIAKKNKK